MAWQAWTGVVAPGKARLGAAWQAWISIHQQRRDDMSRATEKFDELIGEVEPLPLPGKVREFVEVAKAIRLEKHRAWLDARNARYAARRAASRPQEAQP
jgi:hypothetical protein